MTQVKKIEAGYAHGYIDNKYVNEILEYYDEKLIERGGVGMMGFKDAWSGVDDKLY